MNEIALMFSRKNSKNVDKSPIEEVPERLENELRNFERTNTPSKAVVEYCVKDIEQIQLCIKIEEEVKKLYSCTIKVIEMVENVNEEFNESSTESKSEFDFCYKSEDCSFSDKMEHQKNLENFHSMVFSKLSNLQTNIKDDRCLKELINKFLGYCKSTIDKQGEIGKKEMDVILVDAKDLKEKIINYINDNYLNQNNQDNDIL